MAGEGWRDDSAYEILDRLDVAGLAWEFARRDPKLRAAARDGAVDLAAWGLAARADPSLDAEETEVWWRWDFAEGVVIRFVETPGATLTIARLRAAAVASELRFLRFRNGLRAELPEVADEMATVAAVLPLDHRFAVRVAAVRSLRQGLAGRWRAIPLPPRWRRSRLRRMLRTLDARTAGASWREIAAALFARRFSGSTDWRDASERSLVVRLAAAGRLLVCGGYVVLLRRKAASKG